MAKTAIKTPRYSTRLAAALRKKLAGAEVCPEQIRRDRYRFVVVWNGFDDVDHPTRQRLVWDIAEEVLEPDELRNIGMIVTLGVKE